MVCNSIGSHCRADVVVPTQTFDTSRLSNVTRSPNVEDDARVVSLRLLQGSITLVLTSLVVEPVVINLLLILQSNHVASNVQCHLNPEVWIRSTIVIHLTVANLVLSNESKPAGHLYRIFTLLLIVSQIFNLFLRE